MYLQRKKLTTVWPDDIVRCMRPVALDHTCLEQGLVPGRSKRHPKIIEPLKTVRGDEIRRTPRLSGFAHTSVSCCLQKVSSLLNGCYFAALPLKSRMNVLPVRKPTLRHPWCRWFVR